MLVGCSPPNVAEAPRLLTPTELAALTEQAAGAPPDDGLTNRADVLRVRAAGLRAGAGATDDELRRRAAALRAGG